MDYTIALAVAGIIGYGIIEYHRRELLHREAMACLKIGKEPPSEPGRPPLWKLVTTGIVGLILLALAALMCGLAFTEQRGMTAYLTIALIFGVLFYFILLMHLRDLRLFRRTTVPERR